MSFTRLLLLSAVAVGLAVNTSQAALFNNATSLAGSVAFAQEPVFSPVGFVGGIDDTFPFLLGSAVLIDREYVLTAGHVALDGGTTLQENISFSLSDNLFTSTADDFVVVEEIFVAPGYSEDLPPGRGPDIALLKLASPIDDVSPATRFRGEDSVGTRIRAAGYGIPGVFLQSPLAGDGILRGGENVIEQFGFPLTFDEAFQIIGLELNSFDQDSLPFEWISSAFDSGGGWFNDDGELVGLTNFSAGRLAGGIRVSQFNDWIDATIAANTVPEPGAGSLLVSTLLVLAAKRRRVT